MHRKMVLERVKKCTYEELVDWRMHVQFCLDYYQKENNSFEIEECEYLLSHLDEQMAKIVR